MSPKETNKERIKASVFKWQRVHCQIVFSQAKGCQRW